jgi:hypothetical protein
MSTESRGRVSIDVANASQSVTATVKKLLGGETRIAPEDVQLLRSGWVKLSRGGSHVYMSPRAIESVLVEDGDLAEWD